MRGLAISRTLKQQMGGTLELRNRSYSGGAVVKLSFPREPKPPISMRLTLMKNLTCLVTPCRNKG
jgi:K+-sensing histidine kinase KdpD